MSDTHPTRFTVDANGVLREVEHPGEYLPELRNPEERAFLRPLHTRREVEYACARQSPLDAWTHELLRSIEKINHSTKMIDEARQRIAIATNHLLQFTAEPPDPWLDQPLTPEEQQAVDEADAMLDSGEGEEL